MDKISEIGGKLKKTAQSTAEVLKLGRMISDEEKHIDKCFLNIGKEYFSKHAENPGSASEELADFISQINNAKSKIADYSEQVKKLKGIVKCENCNEEIPHGTLFCSKCGASIGTFTEGGDIYKKETEVTSISANAPVYVEKAHLIFMAVAGLLCIMFFLPFITIGAIMFAGMEITPEISLNGWRSFAGYEGEGGIFVAILLFLLPVVLLLLFLLKDKLAFIKDKKQLFLYSTALCGLSIIVSIIFAVSVNSIYEGMAFLGAGSVISLLLHIISTIFSIVCLVSTKK